MSRDTTVIAFRQPDALDDPLTDLAREGARRILAQVLIAEADAFVAMWKDVKLPDGRDRIVRHGHGPHRAIQTGIGPVEVRRAKVRDRGDVAAEEKIRFSSAILPKWARRTKSLDALLPILYLRGVSTGDFQEALAALLGKEAPNLSPAVISRLTAEWQADYDTWQKRDLSARRYVYVWADGVYLQARMEDNAECMLVLIGATPEGKKELVGFQTGVRESGQSWRELLIDVKQRGLDIAPDLAVGDGALGFWKAIEEVFPSTRHQRCWVHKTANVLNKVALSVQLNMKADLREIYGAPTRAAAEVAIDVFAEKYGAKYDKAVVCLTKDRETLLAFFDFPAEHWEHLRTSNPIESIFATVRHRTVRTKGALSAKTAKLMVFKLVNATAKTWRRLNGENQLPKVVQGVKFQNGIEVTERGNEFKVVNWLRAAAIIARADPIAAGYLAKDARGRLRLPVLRKQGTLDLQAALPNQSNLLVEYALHNLSADADAVFSAPAVVQAQQLLATLAPKFGYDPNLRAAYNTKYRNPVLSYLSAERLQIIYVNAGLDAVASEVAKLKAMGII